MKLIMFNSFLGSDEEQESSQSYGMLTCRAVPQLQL